MDTPRHRYRPGGTPPATPRAVRRRLDGFDLALQRATELLSDCLAADLRRYEHHPPLQVADARRAMGEAMTRLLELRAKVIASAPPMATGVPVAEADTLNTAENENRTTDT